MSSQQNINFENYIPTDKFGSSKNLNRKTLNILIEKTKKSTEEKKNVFYSFSKNFKLNFNIKELKKFKKFKRIVTIGFRRINIRNTSCKLFLKKKIKKRIDIFK